MKIRQFVSPLITPVQHGFHLNHSCLTQLLQTIHCLTQSLDKGVSSNVVFLDFSKAFDSVSHQRLLLKLKHIGIRGRNLKWIEAFLTDREQTVIIQVQSSTWVKVTSGVSQGTVLGPLLFLIYIMIWLMLFVICLLDYLQMTVSYSKQLGVQVIVKGYKKISVIHRAGAQSGSFD